MLFFNHQECTGSIQTKKTPGQDLQRGRSVWKKKAFVFLEKKELGKTFPKMKKLVSGKGEDLLNRNSSSFLLPDGPSVEASQEGSLMEIIRK